MTPEQIAALGARITALENFVAEVRDCVPDLFGADHNFIAVEVIETFQADALELMPYEGLSVPQIDPNTRVVTVDQLERLELRLRYAGFARSADENPRYHWDVL